MYASRQRQTILSIKEQNRALLQSALHGESINQHIEIQFGFRSLTDYYCAVCDSTCTDQELEQFLRERSSCGV